MKDTSTGKLARYNLFMENVGKDMGIDQMFEQIYYNEVNEKRTQIGMIDRDVKQLSINEKRFILVKPVSK